MQQTQVIKNKLSEHFKRDENTSSLFHQLSLYIYETEAKETDLHILAKILPEENLMKLIAYYDGDILKMPSKEKYEDCLFLALCYYLKEIKGWNWNQIKEFLNLPEHNQDLLNPIIVGRKISKVKSNIERYLLKVLKETEITENEIKNLVDSLKKE